MQVVTTQYTANIHKINGQANRTCFEYEVRASLHHDATHLRPRYYIQVRDASMQEVNLHEN